MKYFLLGLGIALVSVLIAYLMDDWSLVYMIAGSVGIIALIWGVLVSRVFGGGNSSARTTSSEKRKERQLRFAKMKNALLFAVPNFAVAIINALMLQ